ncbi:Zn-dependent exopeptidase M28 [Clostridiaceae bacterium]|nr:Zn-dependent exopeptidase M28 [Clostridiaceae bacterium]RKI16879.1 Zn-dependent exopeptidase M28 [bacterium 1XD21-70]
MKFLHKSRRTIFLGAVLAAAMAAGGCAGPSTRVLPRESEKQQTVQEEVPVLEESNPFYLREEVEILAASARAAGSGEEREAVRYIQQLLQDYGYEVSLQRFTYQTAAVGDKVTGTNVVAVRQTDDPMSDILIVGAHHDTHPDSPGAGEGAAGVAALLETARLVSRMPSDTQLRFVSFSGYVDEQAGCQQYVDSLTEQERQRVIGAVLLDGLACSLDNGIVLGTEDGRKTLLGDSLRGAGQELLRENWPYEGKAEGGHCRFVHGRIPAVSVGQQRETYENGSRFDRPETVDIERLSQVVNVLSRAVSDIMSDETPSMIAKSRHYNNLRDEAAVQAAGMPVPFGEDPVQTSRRLGMQGKLFAENEDNGGRPIQVYQYPVKWFGVDQTLLTNYYYTEGELTSLAVDGDGAGVGFEEMRERLVRVYGEPMQQDEGPKGVQYLWQDPVSRTSVSFVPSGDGYQLELHQFEPGELLLDSYEVLPALGAGQQSGLGRRLGETSGAQDPRVNVLLARLRQLLPAGGGIELERVDIYTDGIGGSKTLLEAVRPEGDATEEGAAPVFVWKLDLEDAFWEGGRWRNETDTVRQILLLYGESLSQTERYYTAFAQAFPESGDVTERVMLGAKPGESKKTLPDLKESFMWFVLTGHPGEADGEWGARIRFFYQYEELAAYRTQIRNNLKIDR